MIYKIKRARIARISGNDRALRRFATFLSQLALHPFPFFLFYHFFSFLKYYYYQNFIYSFGDRTLFGFLDIIWTEKTRPILIQFYIEENIERTCFSLKKISVEFYNSLDSALNLLYNFSIIELKASITPCPVFAEVI